MRISTGLPFLILYVVLIIAGGYGWVMNIVKIIPMSEITGMIILRAAGIFVAPLGAVLGYIG